MRKSFVQYVLLGTIIIACKPTETPILYGDISGIVKDDANGEAIKNAQVSYTNQDGSISQRVTPETGTYIFERLDTGEYTLIADHKDYETSNQTVRILAGEVTIFDFSLRKQAAPIEISPASLDFARDESSKVVSLKNGFGKGSVGYTIKANEDWINIRPNSGTVTDNQIVSLTITVDRKGLAYGQYNGSFVVNADNNSFIYNITMINPNPNTPSVITGEPTNITQTSAEIIGQLTSKGGSEVSQRGHCWSESNNPTISDAKTQLGPSQLGAIPSSIINLEKGKTYYVRAYATNASGTSYGNLKSFVSASLPTAPGVATGEVSEITISGAKIVGNLTNSGGVDITAKFGHCWSTNTNPTINDFKTEFPATSKETDFVSDIKSLKEGTKYYARAYAINNIGTSYGNLVSFETKIPVTPPSIITGATTNIEQTSAIVNATVNNLGSLAIIQHGFCWSTKNANPTINDNKNQLGSLAKTGSYSSSLSLKKGTNYYVRPYLQFSDGSLFFGVVSDFVTKEAGLVSILTLNNNLNDFSGNSNDLSSQEELLFDNDRFLNIKSSLKISGKYQGSLFQNKDIGQFTNQFSICFWIKLNSNNFYGSFKQIIGKAAGSCYDYSRVNSDSYSIFINPNLNNKINFGISESTLYSNKNFYKVVPLFDYTSAEEWVQICIVFNNGQISFFLNGVEVGNFFYGSFPKMPNYNSFAIGGNGCESFEGLIDDFRIYSKALTNDEVKDIYNR